MSAVVLGLFEAMSRRVGRVAAFRPLTRDGARDRLLELIERRYLIDVRPAWGTTYDHIYADPDAAMATVLERFGTLDHENDAVLVIGTDYRAAGAANEPSLNAQLATNLSAAAIVVVDGRSGEDADEVATAAALARSVLIEHGAPVLGVVANRVPPERMNDVRVSLERIRREPEELIAVMPGSRLIEAPSVEQVLEACDAHLISGDPNRLDDQALAFTVAAMTLPRVLGGLKTGGLVFVPGDRFDILVGVLMAHRSNTFPRLSGVVLTGGVTPDPIITRLLAGLGTGLPVALTNRTTFDAATRVAAARGRLTDGSWRRADAALSLVSQHLDTTALLDRLDLTRSRTVTPLMFEHDLAERARADRRRIVLPEGTEPRVLRAAAAVTKRGIADIILLGAPEQVLAAATQSGVDLTGMEILDPCDEKLRHRMAAEYAAARAHKGITFEAALDIVTDVSYAGTLLVRLGLADGMVSGAVHTTAHTIRPAFELIGTREGTSIVSSVFFMCLADRVLVYGDCAVNPDPTAPQLADIAVSSAHTAEAFGVEPRVALLSYSTGDSGHGVDVDKVRQATELVRGRAPDLAVEGPIQYDAATDAGVAATKLPGSAVAGRATVLIFPDLNTGNNTYKAVQRSAGALAVGPVLQGLRKPVNDLSRGATVQDIITTIAITAVQAQQLTAEADAVPSGTVSSGTVPSGTTTGPVAK
ncbi:MAG: phosphate acetyltransferase [Actinomycetota bacterium]|nr:phosphate acetyltransferase [Actinomycetota bacterium]